MRRRRTLEHCFRVVLVDEHRTSSFHYGTATRLRDIFRIGEGRYVRGVQWYDATTTVGCMQFTHRNANAAMNARWCLLECNGSSQCSAALPARCTCSVASPS
jgi:hypothetical protein